MFYRDAQLAFNEALQNRHMFLDKPGGHDDNRPCVSQYMYMYSNGSSDYFKHIHTREYLIIRIYQDQIARITPD